MNVDVLANTKKEVKLMPKKAATITLRSTLNQSLITEFFNTSFKRIQNKSAAAYAASVASPASSVPANGKRDPQDPEV